MKEKTEMKSKRQSIHIPVKMRKFIEAFGDSNSLSGSIATIIGRYEAMTAEAMPSFTDKEWMAICDVLNGCGALLSSGGHDQSWFIWAEMAESEQAGTGEKWGVSCRSLSEKLRSLPFSGRCAVWDVAARFWASPRLNEIDVLDLLKESGAKIEEHTEP